MGTATRPLTGLARVPGSQFGMTNGSCSGPTRHPTAHVVWSIRGVLRQAERAWMSGNRVAGITTGL